MSLKILIIVLAVIFLVSGLAKLSGTSAGLSGTRSVGVKDWLAKVIGGTEVVAAVGLVLWLRDSQSTIGWGSAVYLWLAMGGAIYAHFRAHQLRTAFPAFFLLTLLSIALALAAK